MTTGGMEVDLDRLADFVGGALDGTPDAADVRHLIETDPRWAEAHAALVVADAAMRERLGAWGAEPEPMPDDVRLRLDAALAAAPRVAPLVRDELAARRSRRQRWMVGLATAAAILVCGVGGVAIVQQQRESADSGGTSTAVRNGNDEGPAAPSPAQGGPGSGGGLLFSGRDYSPDTLGQLASASPAVPGPAENTNKSGVQGFNADSAGPLQRLADPAARAACLESITAEYGGRVVLVDFAKYQGSPAVIVVLEGARIAAGKRLVVVVGPTCGTGKAIADERYHTTV